MNRVVSTVFWYDLRQRNLQHDINDIKLTDGAILTVFCYYSVFNIAINLYFHFGRDLFLTVNCNTMISPSSNPLKPLTYAKVAFFINGFKRLKSSQQWLIRQKADPYVEKAKINNYRSE